MREDVIEPIATSLEFIGVAIIALGILAASIGLLRAVYLRLGTRSALGAIFDLGKWNTALEPEFAPYRQDLLRVIVLGLTFLVAGDIVQTASVDRTLGDVGSLAIVVVIREFLSVALAMETTGHWPWQHRKPAKTAASEPPAPRERHPEEPPEATAPGFEDTQPLATQD